MRTKKPKTERSCKKCTKSFMGSLFQTCGECRWDARFAKPDPAVEDEASEEYICECDRPKAKGAIGCDTCLDKDGRTVPEANVISALRVLGGSGQMAAIVEDLGGSIHDDTNSNAYRRAYRGLADLRKRNAISTTSEIPENLQFNLKYHKLTKDEIAMRRGCGFVGKPRFGYYKAAKPEKERGCARVTPGGGVVTYTLKVS